MDGNDIKPIENFLDWLEEPQPGCHCISPTGCKIECQQRRRDREQLEHINHLDWFEEMVRASDRQHLHHREEHDRDYDHER